jgi:uncharacterized membrane protein YdjX (TVP38/TMEM64 family)
VSSPRGYDSRSDAEPGVLSRGFVSGAEPDRVATHRRVPVVRVATALVVLILLAIAGRYVGESLPRFAEWVDGFGAWGPLAFVLAYAVLVVAFVPGVVLTMAAGAIFGVTQGTIVVFVGATFGATAAFLVSRYFARSFVAARVAGDTRFAAIDRAVEREGLRIVFLLRLSPVVPFNLLNYALGLTRVRMRDYMLASAGMLPGTLLYVYSGKVAGDVASIASGAGVERGIEHYLFLALGLAATVAVTAVITRIARRALAATTDPEPPA